MIKLLDSTQFVIGIFSLRACVFECESMEDVIRLRTTYTGAPGVTPHSGLSVYTRNEWLFRQVGPAKVSRLPESVVVRMLADLVPESHVALEELFTDVRERP